MGGNFAIVLCTMVAVDVGLSNDAFTAGRMLREGRTARPFDGKTRG